MLLARRHWGHRSRRPFQRIEKVARRLPPIARILRETLLDDTLERRRHKRSNRRHRRRFHVEDRADQVSLSLRLKSFPARHHFVDTAPNEKMSERASTASLFTCSGDMY